MIEQYSECGGKVSSTADQCPHCGHRNRPARVAGVAETLNSIWQLFLFGVLGLFLVAAAIFVIMSL
jgi:hypothetical protein